MPGLDQGRSLLKRLSSITASSAEAGGQASAPKHIGLDAVVPTLGPVGGVLGQGRLLDYAQWGMDHEREKFRGRGRFAATGFHHISGCANTSRPPFRFTRASEPRARGWGRCGGGAEGLPHIEHSDFFTAESKEKGADLSLGGRFWI